MDTEAKSKNKVWVIALGLLAIVAVAFIYLRKPQQTENQTNQIKVPQELILGERKQQTDIIKTGFSDPEKVDFVQFATSKSREELIQVYTTKFSTDGWVVIESRPVKSQYLIFAENNSNGRVVQILILASQPNFPTTVSITYREL